MSDLKAYAVGDSDTYAAYDAQGALDAANDHVGGGMILSTVSMKFESLVRQSLIFLGRSLMNMRK